MAASLNLLPITSVDLMHPQSKALPVQCRLFTNRIWPTDLTISAYAARQISRCISGLPSLTHNGLWPPARETTRVWALCGPEQSRARLYRVPSSVFMYRPI